MTDKKVLEYIQALTNRIEAMQKAAKPEQAERFSKIFDETIEVLEEWTEEIQREIGGK